LGSGGYPKVVAALLKRWLALFHVHYRPEMLVRLREFESAGRGTLTLEPVGRRYAYLARFVKAG
jgi:S-adenosylmethionine-diacylgycerolhomoserine-N-methlytransferase